MKYAITYAECIVTHRTWLGTQRGICRDRLACFEKSPVRLDPERLRYLSLDAVLATRRIKYPAPAARRVLKNVTATARSKHVAQDGIALAHRHSVHGRINYQVGFPGPLPCDLFLQAQR